MKFVLTSKIAKAMKDDGFVGALIYGSQRLGKSSYASQILYDLYQDWDMVNEHMLFELDDVVKVLHRALKERKKIPAIVWDDAGVHANKFLYFRNRTLVQYLQNLFDVIGLNLGGLLITTPSPNNLLRVIRGYEWYRVKIYRRNEYHDRFAVAYQSVLLPSGSRLIKRAFKDNFNVILPNEFWDPYLEKRQTYLEIGIAQLQALAEKQVGELERTPGEVAVSDEGRGAGLFALPLVSNKRSDGGGEW